jgi:hypothetical protein
VLRRLFDARFGRTLSALVPAAAAVAVKAAVVDRTTRGQGKAGAVRVRAATAAGALGKFKFINSPVVIFALSYRAAASSFWSVNEPSSVFFPLIVICTRHFLLRAFQHIPYIYFF